MVRCAPFFLRFFPSLHFSHWIPFTEYWFWLTKFVMWFCIYNSQQLNWNRIFWIKLLRCWFCLFRHFRVFWVKIKKETWTIDEMPWVHHVFTLMIWFLTLFSVTFANEGEVSFQSSNHMKICEEIILSSQRNHFSEPLLL